MAILCLARNLSDLKTRIGHVIVGYDSMRQPITAADIGVNGAMTALLKNAINPNLVQTIEGVPAFVHGGPFANIAHGCNTLTATQMALKLADYVVTEAGFGADLGAEKFVDIKCRAGNLNPSAAVLVVPKRAWDLHGIDNVRQHVEIIRRFNLPAIVSINRYADDADDDLVTIRSVCRDHGIDAVITDYREAGGDGGLELAERLDTLCQRPTPTLEYLYPLDLPIADKVTTIAREIYGATAVEMTGSAAREIKQIENLGFQNLPVCMAKTPMSLTDDPKIPGRPEQFTITITRAKVSAGAGFVVVYAGKMMTMPGLPKVPSALRIDIDDQGTISGLF
jgi:formate--tetrahydrofolate ligase